MSDEPKSFWWKFWGRPVRFFLWLTFLSLLATFAIGIIVDKMGHGPDWSDFGATVINLVFFSLFIAGAFGLMLSAIPRTRSWMKWVLRRWFFCAALFATLVALFYTEENWRGRRAWEQCKHDLEAKGFVLDWEKLIPPPVPDEQNIYKAPKMTGWFVRTSPKSAEASEFDKRLSSNKQTLATITNAAEARAYLDWSRQFDSELGLIRDSLQRPYARIDTDYSNPSTMGIPEFMVIRSVVRVLAQRAKCELVLGQPDAALSNLTLIHDLSHLLEGKPTGKPMTLVGAMINVAISGPYVESVRVGLQLKAWQEPQLIAIQQQLAGMKLMPLVDEAFRCEMVFYTHLIGGNSRAELNKIFQIFSPPPPKSSLFNHMLNRPFLFIALAPKGWMYWNMMTREQVVQMYFDCVDPQNEIVRPSQQDKMNRALQALLSNGSPYVYLAALTTPSFSKATQTMARNQTFINEALVACALERYRAAHGEYPESLEALAPQFIERVPHDVIDDGALNYHRIADAFLLYSVGWNEKDDGGLAVMNKDGQPDASSGDWVWGLSSK